MNVVATELANYKLHFVFVGEFKSIKLGTERAVDVIFFKREYNRKCRTGFVVHRSNVSTFEGVYCINPINPELNPICHFLALLGAHHILHVGRIKINESSLYVYS